MSHREKLCCLGIGRLAELHFRWPFLRRASHQSREILEADLQLPVKWRAALGWVVCPTSDFPSVAAACGISRSANSVTCISGIRTYVTSTSALGHSALDHSALGHSALCNSALGYSALGHSAPMLHTAESPHPELHPADGARAHGVTGRHHPRDEFPDAEWGRYEPMSDTTACGHGATTVRNDPALKIHA